MPWLDLLSLQSNIFACRACRKCRTDLIPSHTDPAGFALLIYALFMQTGEQRERENHKNNSIKMKR